MAKGVLRTDKKVIDEKFLEDWFEKLSMKRKFEIVGAGTPKILFKRWIELDYTNQIGWYFIYQ